MSVAIATMGKFIPATGGTRVVTQTVEVGGGSYGWNERKPQIVINSVRSDDDKFNIKVTKVVEW